MLRNIFYLMAIGWVIVITSYVVAWIIVPKEWELYESKQFKSYRIGKMGLFGVKWYRRSFYDYMSSARVSYVMYETTSLNKAMRDLNNLKEDEKLKRMKKQMDRNAEWKPVK